MIMTREDKYVDAIKNYETVVLKYLKNPLLKGSARNLIMKNVILYLAIEDMVGAKRSLDTFKDTDPTLDGSRELNFLEAIIKAIEE